MLKFPHLLLAGALCASAPWVSTPLYAQTVAPTSIPSTFLPAPKPGVPGLRREVGAWLFNDSIFASPGENRGAVGGPVFIPNLRRDKKNKLPLFMPQKSGVPLRFSTLPLPGLRALKREESKVAGLDLAAFQTDLQTQVAAAKAAGQVYLGFSLSVGAGKPGVGGAGSLAPAPSLDSNYPTYSVEDLQALFKKLRGVLDAVAPDAALILEVDGLSNPNVAVSDISAAAPYCDAVVLHLDPSDSNALWPLKMARRVAEEQPDYDLPIFVAPLIDLSSANRAAFEARLLEMWMGGATGFVLPEAQVPAWSSVVARNPGLFGGAVTLEDAAVLPSRNSRTLALVEQLRAAGRVPLAGRLPGDGRGGNGRGESLLAVLDETTSLDTLNGLDKAARSGNSVYLEGVPDLRNPAVLTKLSDMTSTTITVSPAPKPEVLTLSDPWLFGDARGREIAVTQRVTWTLKTSLAAQARKKKGEDVLEAYSAAKLAGDENGILVAPLGKGRVMWLAHSPLVTRGDEAARRDYYAAIAGGLQGGLARLSFDSPEAQARDGADLRFTLRASKNGTPIIALFNRGTTEAQVTLSARSDAPVALDLSTEREIAAQVSGYTSSVKVTVPANGYTWLAFGATRATLDKERLAPRPKAKSR